MQRSLCRGAHVPRSSIRITLNLPPRMTDTELLNALASLNTECVIVGDPSGSVRVKIGSTTPLLDSDLRAALKRALVPRTR